MMNVLIVDDNKGDRRTIKLALEEAGLSCECTETANVEQALEACGKYAFDCAIVDYRMPGRDGLYGITALHERLPYMALIMASGEGDEIVAAEAIKLGASDYISKTNIRAESLKRIIENARERTTLGHIPIKGIPFFGEQ
jgi:DNA-binding NtrC family response regulator